MFHTPIWIMLLVVIHSSKNKAVKLDGFPEIFMKVCSSPRWLTIFKLNNTVCGRSLTVIVMSEPVRFCCLHYFLLQG